MAKTASPVTRKKFAESAKPVTVVVNNMPMIAAPKEFSTGSLGWYLNGKTVIEIDGIPVTVQVGMNMTIVGSKELPKDE